MESQAFLSVDGESATNGNLVYWIPLYDVAKRIRVVGLDPVELAAEYLARIGKRVGKLLGEAEIIVWRMTKQIPPAISTRMELSVVKRVVV
jgi:hypothetical protein